MRIGITGGIASGKSTVARLLAERGALVFSADEAARAVVAPGSDALAKVVELLGSSVVQADGALDRAETGRIVFADDRKRRGLERIVHPAVLKLLKAQVEAAEVDLRGSWLVAVEAPLLYEAGMKSWFDAVIVVTCSAREQVNRLMTRNGLSAPEAARRVVAQMPLDQKAAMADFVVANDGSEADLAVAVNNLWKGLLALNAGSTNQA